MGRALRKRNYPFYFSVEGQTEKWYLEHLQRLINAALSAQEAPLTVTFHVRVEKSPLSYVKAMTPMGGEKTVVTHVFDYEGAHNLPQFQRTLKEMREAAKQKRVDYRLGYSNLSFELWMILHKRDCNGSKTSVEDYESGLHSAYPCTAGLSLDAYKEEKNFRRILEEIALDDVRKAIERAQKIEEHNHENYKPQFHCGYEFFKENPSLNFHKRIRDIFDFCKV